MGDMIVMAKLIVVNARYDGDDRAEVLGDFEFSQLPRIGEAISLPVLSNTVFAYKFDGYTVQNVIHRPREFPRVSNPHAPSEDAVEPHTIIWIVGE